MSLRLSGAIVRASSQNGSYIRFLCSGKEFSSILNGKSTPSPFADPSRKRESKALTGAGKIDTASNDTTLLSSKVIKEVQHTEPVEEVKLSHESSPPAPTPQIHSVKEDRPLSAIEELSLLNQQLETSAASTGKEGSGGSGHEEFDSHAEAEKRRKRMERNTRIGGMVLLGGSIAGLISFCVYYGRAKRNEDGTIIHDEHTGKLMAPFYRIYDSLWQWRDFVVEPAREKLLPDPLPAPYLQPKYTLVIELKNILVSPEWTYKTGYRFAKRPALDYFLDVVGYPNFEVVIYTSESAMTAIPVIDSIDPKQRIMFRLYRDCTKYANGHHIKDLSKLNRDLKKVIFIEYDAKSGQLNPENMLRVPEWKGNMDDTTLVDLAELLKTIHLSDTDDVRETLQYYSQFDDPAKEFRKRAIFLAQQEEEKKMHQGDDQSMLKRYSGRLFGYRRHQST